MEEAAHGAAISWMSSGHSLFSSAHPGPEYAFPTAEDRPLPFQLVSSLLWALTIDSSFLQGISDAAHGKSLQTHGRGGRAQPCPLSGALRPNAPALGGNIWGGRKRRKTELGVAEQTSVCLIRMMLSLSSNYSGSCSRPVPLGKCPVGGRHRSFMTNSHFPHLHQIRGHRDCSK